MRQRLDKPILLRSSHRAAPRGSGQIRGSAVILVILLAGLNYWLFFQGGDALEPPSIQERLNQPMGVPPADRTGVYPSDRVAPPSDDTQNQQEHFAPADELGEPLERRVAGKLKRGQTILRALAGLGVDRGAALPITRAMSSVFDFRNAQVGDQFEAMIDSQGAVQSFRYVHSPLDVYEVTLAPIGEYVAERVEVPTRVEVAHVGCHVKSSLYGAMARCGESPQLGARFIDLFAWDVDFFQDVRPGDQFRVMVEKVSVDGQFLQYGRVLAAEYTGKFGQHRIVHYTPPGGKPGYYTDSGRAVRKEFLKSPLKYTRVASRNGHGKRKGLKRSSAAVYTANAGTQVWAVASGKVIFAGTSGSLGKTVTIKHDNGFTSTYGHLAKIPSDIQVGAELSQKHVIGTVGQSGSATEPKLLFSLRKNGKLVNPMRLKFNESGPVSDEVRGHFDQHAGEVLKTLEAIPVLSNQEHRS